MISQLNGANIRTAYANSLGENKESTQKSGFSVSKQGDLSKVDQIKEALASGEYKINLQALSEKMAQELL
ncbi:MAG: flagellar biosynthesis anti-sigma factor FlgM [Sulfurimonas sp.]|uniref:flagellar biosynthesis anti-sigma factor FlgM n=1 Tax=Sulfurimonas sp. TaxID=2022749 RepID=UPI0026082635|nr:flagellar biosynthesis anti-sigma factor FlgM [Sulfurimonas sp.]MDD2653402.1 flagellar biosynthesis anti-sigma factor FlgM [Sulfurimonas sp.]MDD3452600.1 flagellar biosynthesis anti-sigma factor FlgM [Sulfurimonas sp.]